MRELKELLCEGERVYELTRCASSSVYFIGPETDDINHMDVSGALEDTLHRMVDAGFTEEEIAEHLCAYQDSDAMDDDDCYYIDLDYVIYDFYPMSIIDTGIHYEESRNGRVGCCRIYPCRGKRQTDLYKKFVENFTFL